MNDKVYNVALRSALGGIKNATTDLNWSFILKNDGTVITSEENSDDPIMTKAASSLQSLAEMSGAIGGLDKMLVDGDNCKVYVSSINNMYLVAGLAKNADLAYFRTITSAVFPAIFKVLESISSPLTPAPAPIPAPLKPTPLIPSSTTKPLPTKPLPMDLKIEKEPEKETVEEEEESEDAEEQQESAIQEPTHELQTVENERTPIEDVPSQQFIVDRFSGLMVKADTVQLDADVLKRWTSILDIDQVKEVDVETFSGKTVRCKAKVINDPKLEGRGLIRIPEKTCQSLEVKRGELVRVKPVPLEEGE